MDPRTALTDLARAVGRGDTDVIVADVDWDTFAPRFTALRPSPLLATLPEAAAALAARSAPNEPAPAPALAGRLAASGAEREAPPLQLAAARSPPSSATPPPNRSGPTRRSKRPRLRLADRRGICAYRLSRRGRRRPARHRRLRLPHPRRTRRPGRHDLTGDTSVLTPVLAELDGLEAAFARVADEDPAARARVTQRMRRFLERLAALERDDTAPPDATGVESASDEELFALLDDHL
ncbi:Polyketide synthase OS=Streptomyces fumanus OX=67302 GN=GCM10018772_62360 PE=4 SV=1 [Streptomyces fumanus]